MIATLIGLVFFLVAVGVILWGAQTILARIPLSEPFRTILYVIIVIVGVLIALAVLRTLLIQVGVPIHTFSVGAITGACLR